MSGKIVIFFAALVLLMPVSASVEKRWEVPIPRIHEFVVLADGSIVTTSFGNTIYYINKTGGVVWQKEFNKELFAVQATDLNRDGHDEVIVSYGDTKTGGVSVGFLKAFDRSGRELWRFPPERIGVGSTTIVRNICLGDLNNDNYMEILCGSESSISLFDSIGSKKWSFNAKDTISRVFTADVDGDGYDEAIGISEKKIYILNSEGNLTLALFLKNGINSAFVTDQAIAISTYDKYLYVFNFPLDFSKVNTTIVQQGSQKFTAFAIENMADVDGWQYEPAEIVEDIMISDINKDGLYDTAFVTKNGMFLMDKEGALSWSIRNGGKRITTANLYGDGTLYIVAANSSILFAVNMDGKTEWDYDLEGITGIKALDVDSDGLDELVVSTENAIILLATEKTKIKKKQAINYLQIAEKYLGEKDYINAKASVFKAKDIYTKINDSAGQNAANSIISRIEMAAADEKRAEADKNYGLAELYYTGENYENAKIYAGLARSEYEEINDTQGVAKCDKLSLLISNASNKTLVQPLVLVETPINVVNSPEYDIASVFIILGILFGILFIFFYIAKKKRKPKEKPKESKLGEKYKLENEGIEDIANKEVHDEIE